MSRFTYGSAMAQPHQQHFEEMAASCVCDWGESSQRMDGDNQKTVGVQTKISSSDLGLVHDGEWLIQALVKTERLDEAAEESRDKETDELIVPHQAYEWDELQEELATDCEMASGTGREEIAEQGIIIKEPEVDVSVTNKNSEVRKRLVNIDQSGYKLDSSGRFLGLNRPKNLKGINWLCDQLGCAFECRTKKKLKEHLETHGFEFSFKCEECDETFEKRNLLERHRSVVHNERRFQCDFDGCGKKFHSERRLKQHQLSSVHSGETVRSDRPFFCTQPGCYFRFSTKIHLEVHLIKRHSDEEKFDCRREESGSKNRENCGDKQEMNKKVIEKLANNFDLSGYKLDSAGRFLGLDRPKKLRGVRYWLCDQPGCAFEGTRKEKLEEHLLTHGVEFSFACQECGRTFKKRQFLLRHQSNVHKEKRFYCDFDGCDKKFYNGWTFKEHQRLVHSDKSFACDWPGCEFRCVKDEWLTVHRQRVHEKIRNVECAWFGCGKRFFNDKTMKEHYNQHIGKNIKCKHPDCGKYFTYRCTMDRHFRNKHKQKS